MWPLGQRDKKCFVQELPRPVRNGVGGVCGRVGEPRWSGRGPLERSSEQRELSRLGRLLAVANHEPGHNENDYPE